MSTFVLAYSGGLDTSVILAWLQVHHGAAVVTVTADLGQQRELDGIEQKALACGAAQVHVDDLRDEFVTDYVWPSLKAGALYQGIYPLASALGRPLIAKRLVEVAREVGADAIVSTDGDGDRPIVVDEHGRFHRGDVLGIITADFLGAAFAAVPINTTDALDKWVQQSRPAMMVEKTRIGSPYVIAAMQRAIAEETTRVVAWEANGGFLTGTDFTVNGRLLPALATRDAVLPILAALLSAVRRGVPVSQLFDELPQRATCSGLLDDFSQLASQAILARFSPGGVLWLGLR